MLVDANNNNKNLKIRDEVNSIAEDISFPHLFSPDTNEPMALKCLLLVSEFNVI